VRNWIERPQLQGHLRGRNDWALSVWILPLRMGQREQVFIGQLLGHRWTDEILVEMRIARHLSSATQTVSIGSNRAARSIDLDHLRARYEVALRAIIRHDPEVSVIIVFSRDNNDHLGKRPLTNALIS